MPVTLTRSFVHFCRHYIHCMGYLFTLHSRGLYAVHVWLHKPFDVWPLQHTNTHSRCCSHVRISQLAATSTGQKVDDVVLYVCRWPWHPSPGTACIWRAWCLATKKQTCKYDRKKAFNYPTHCLNLSIASSSSSSSSCSTAFAYVFYIYIYLIITLLLLIFLIFRSVLL